MLQGDIMEMEGRDTELVGFVSSFLKGKVEVTLQAELGDASHLPAQLPNHHRVSQNGPARQRRRQRRAALGEAAIAGKATEVLDEKADVAEEKRKLGRMKILHLEKLWKQ